MCCAVVSEMAAHGTKKELQAPDVIDVSWCAVAKWLTVG